MDGTHGREESKASEQAGRAKRRKEGNHLYQYSVSNSRHSSFPPPTLGFT